MVTQELVESNISATKRLLEELDQNGFPITAAFWPFPESTRKEWHLVISSRVVDQQGSLPAYQRIQRILANLPDAHISLASIVAVGTNDPVVRVLQEMMPADFIPDDFQLAVDLPGNAEHRVTVPLSNYVSYAPYMEEGVGEVTVYVHRLIPRGRARKQDTA